MTTQTPLVLLPGLACDTRLFASQIADIGSRRSILALRLADAETLDAAADAALAQIPGRAAVVGHGLGGLVALRLAAKAPERVDRLALLGVDPRPETPRRAAEREVEQTRATAGLLRRVLTDDVAPTFVGRGDARLSAARLLVEMGLALGPQTFVAQSRLLQRRPDLSPVLSELDCPVLVVTGRDDRIAGPTRAEVMASRCRTARLEVIDGAGHLAPIESPAAVTAALQRWLTDALVLT